MTYRADLRNWLTPMLYDVLEAAPSRELLAWLWDRRIAPAMLAEAEQWLLAGLLLEGKPGAPRPERYLRTLVKRLPTWWGYLPPPVANVAGQTLDALLLGPVIAPDQVTDDDLALFFDWLDEHPLPCESERR